MNYGVAKFDLYIRLFFNRSIMPDEKNPFMYILDEMKKNLQEVLPSYGS